jgi:hypothetical protein
MSELSLSDLYSSLSEITYRESVFKREDIDRDREGEKGRGDDGVYERRGVEERSEKHSSMGGKEEGDRSESDGESHESSEDEGIYIYMPTSYCDTLTSFIAVDNVYHAFHF